MSDTATLEHAAPVPETGPPADERTARAATTFIYREARLLDEQRWRDWDGLFAADGVYWLPATPGQPDPVNHVSHIYETAQLREIRLRRYENPRAFSLQPMPRTLHMLSNVEIEDHGDCIIAHAALLMIEYRQQAMTHYPGRVRYTLIRAGDSFLMREKRVELVNCDGPIGTTTVYP